MPVFLNVARRTSACLLGAALSVAAAGAQQATALPRYEVDGAFDVARGAIEATVTVRFPAGSAGTEHRLLLGPTYTITALSAEGGTVDSATVSAPIPGLQQLTIRATGSSPVSMRVRYAGRLYELVKPPINVVTDSLVELSVDSFWLPFNANLGAPFVISARMRGLPRNAVAVSSVKVRLADGILYLETGPDGAPDPAVVVATYATVRDAGRMRMLAGDHASPLATYYREHGSAGITFMEKILGPMPGSTASISLVRRASGSGYARPGYVVVTETPGAAPNAGSAKFVVHEFAHLWFSRAPIGTEDYWLSETPAEYLGLRYVRETLGQDAWEALMTPKRTSAASAPPVLGGRGRAPDPTIYAKGPILLFELEQKIGKARLDEVFGRMAREPRHTSAIFLAALGAVAGDAEAQAFEAALRK